MRRFARLGLKTTIAARLVLSFLLVIGVVSVVFIAAGVDLIRNRIVAEATDKVSRDLNAAREIYRGQLRHISDVVRFTADRTLLIDGLLSGDVGYATNKLREVRTREGLDFLTIADPAGNVLVRTSNPNRTGDSVLNERLVRAVTDTGYAAVATVVMSSEALALESHELAERAGFRFVDTPMARLRPETEQTDGMVIMAAAPIYGDDGAFLGTVFGGELLNRNYDIVDRIKETVFENLQYEGHDIGTATIFQDDVRISTNVKNTDGSRAIGTRVAEDVYNRVVGEGLPWVGRAYVVNNWYITAYEPIQDFDGKIIGILYVGILEKKYVDIERETVLVFVAITLLGALGSTVLSYFLARRISIPIRQLASASRELAQGNLDARVEPRTGDELGELADAFNVMSGALKERDERLKATATRKVMESERLALIGQLAANVAHELNNPLTGIVTYSHLLLEKGECDPATSQSVRKIVTQADRCRDIIRGLLDFSRQRKPDKTLCDVNAILQGCLGLLQDQALFLNIEIVERLARDLPPSVMDPSQIERVFMNLIINAAEAMDKGGILTVASRYDAGNGMLEVSVSDTGLGISEENLDKIFDPFFTTKEVGLGTGLGLAISYGIVKEHLGTISVDSKAGQGTTFVVRLPALADKKALTIDGTAAHPGN